MRKIATLVQLVLLVSTLVVARPLTQNEGRFSVAGLSDREAEGFFALFREAIVNRNKKTVASLVNYPITVSLKSGGPKKIRNANDFIRVHDRIFDDEFSGIIAKTDVKDLWAKWSGVAMPKGEIWFAGITNQGKRPANYNIRIIAINGPIRS